MARLTLAASLTVALALSHPEARGEEQSLAQLAAWGVPRLESYFPSDTRIRGDLNQITTLPDGALAIVTSVGVYTFNGTSWERISKISQATQLMNLPDGRTIVASTSGITEIRPDGLGSYTAQLLTPPESLGGRVQTIGHIASARGWIFGLQGTDLVSIGPDGAVSASKLPNWASSLFSIGEELYILGGTTALINRWDWDTRSLVDASALLNDSVYEWMTATYPRANGGVWILTEPGKILGFDGTRSWVWPGTEAIVRLSATINGLAELEDGTIAIATNSKGLLLFDENGAQIAQIAKDSGLDDNNAKKLGIDSQGGLWVATKRSVSRIERRSDTRLFDDRHGLPDDIQSIAFFNGRLYLGGVSGLYVNNPQASASSEAFKPITNLRYVHDLRVYDDRLFVAGSHLATIDGSGAVTVLSQDGATNLHQPSRYPNVMLAGNYRGVLRIDRGPDGWSKAEIVPGLESDVHSIAEALDGRLFGCLQGESVARIDLSTKPGTARKEPLPGSMAGQWNLIARIGDDLYLNSQPCRRFNPKTGEWLVDDQMVYYGGGPPYGFEQVFATSRENAWVCLSSDRSDTVRRPPANVIGAISSLGNSVDTRAYCLAIDSEGYVWAAGPFGVARIRPIPDDGRVQLPTPTVHRLISTRDETPILLERAPGGEVTLLPRQNSLRIETKFANFTGASHNLYQIFVEGLDTAGAPFGVVPFREITNLEPGRYIIHVGAQDASGRLRFNDGLRILLLAPWYHRPWAYAIFAVLAILFVVAIVTFYSRVQIRYNRRLQKLVKERTLEIEQKNRTLEFQATTLERQNIELEHKTEELQATTESLTQTLNRLHDMQDQLIATARTAGKAEIATNVLHNVGNVLNSINTSLAVLSQKVDGSKVARLAQLARLVESRMQDISAFIAEDPKGKHVPDYLIRISDTLTEERASIAYEIASMEKDIEHVKNIIAAQQTHAVSQSVEQDIGLRELTETALMILDRDESARNLEVVNEVDRQCVVHTDKHRLLEIVLNLLSNAFDAIEQRNPDLGVISLAVHPKGQDELEFIVTDNGIGIAPENNRLLFTHGFTTKSNGHGFGLHSSANAARVLGGQLALTSPGPGLGATATLTLPIRRPAKARKPQIPAASDAN